MWLAKTQSPTTCRWGRWGQKRSFPQASITGVRLPYSTTGRSVSGNKSEMMFLGCADQAWSALRYNIIYIYIYVIYNIYIYIIYSMGICSRINGYTISIYPMDICWFICMELMDILVDIYGNLYCRVAGWPMVQTNEALTRTGASRPGSSQVTSCRILRSFWRLARKWGDN